MGGHRLCTHVLCPAPLTHTLTHARCEARAAGAPGPPTSLAPFPEALRRKTSHTFGSTISDSLSRPRPPPVSAPGPADPALASAPVTTRRAAASRGVGRPSPAVLWAAHTAPILGGPSCSREVRPAFARGLCQSGCCRGLSRVQSCPGPRRLVPFHLTAGGEGKAGVWPWRGRRGLSRDLNHLLVTGVPHLASAPGPTARSPERASGRLIRAHRL